MRCSDAHIASVVAQAQWHAVRAQGAGGQNVNKSATAVHLRVHLESAGLSAEWIERIRARAAQSLNGEGELVIKSQSHRSQAMNLRAGRERLRALLAATARPQRARKPTKPPRAATRRRLDGKTHRGRIKQLRRGDDD